MIIDQLPAAVSVDPTDELPIEKGQLTYKATVSQLVGNKVLKATSAVTLQTTQQTYSLPGLTAAHELIRWNFKLGGSDYPENTPPFELAWTTGTDQWTLISSVATGMTCQPIFALP